MNEKLIKILICFFVISSLNSIPIFSQPAEIKGKVIDISTKKPIPNAQVMAYYNNCAAWYDATTDSLGNFSFPNINPFKYNLVCSKTKFITQTIKNIRTPDGSKIIVDFYIRKNKNRNGKTVIDTLEYKDLINSMGKYSDLIGKPTLKKLRYDIKMNWYIRKDSVCYLTNEEFINNIFSVYKYLMMKYTSKEITKLFGKPTQIIIISHNQYFFEYVLDPPCPADVCSSLYFTFDNLDRFREVNRAIMHQPIGR